MALLTRVSVSAHNAMADGIVDLIDAGAGAGTIGIRTGAQPATCATADSGTLLGTLTCSDPAFGAASSGVATASAITSDTSADATGTAGHFRVYDSDSNCVLQGNCGTSGANMNFDDVNIVIGGTIAISAFTVDCTADGA